MRPSGAPARPAARAPSEPPTYASESPTEASSGEAATPGAASGPPASAAETDARDRPPPGPPEDATTSFEDLPADLFGEEDGAASGAEEPRTRGGEPRPEDGGSGRRPTASRPASGPARRTSGPGTGATGDPDGRTAGDGSDRAAPRTRGAAAGGGEEGTASADPALEAVQSLFPGRVIAFQPFEEAGADGEEAGAEDAPLDAVGAEPDGADARTEA